MKINLIAYGIAKDILGGHNVAIEVAEAITVNGLLAQLRTDYPQLIQLNSLVVALNATYAEGDEVINERDEVVLIPPVSGG